MHMDDDPDVHLALGVACDGGTDVFRQFSAEFTYCDENGKDLEVGTFLGWIAWNAHDADVADAGDSISAEASDMGFAASQIIDDAEAEGLWIDDVVLLDRVYLAPQFRGKGNLSKLFGAFAHLLRLDVAEGIIVVQPEPQRPEGGPYDDGPQRERALAGLVRTLEAAGLEPHLHGIWWVPTNAWH